MCLVKFNNWKCYLTNIFYGYQQIKCHTVYAFKAKQNLNLLDAF